MNSEPLVTAIITTYRRDEQILSRAINSVVNQTYKNIEIVVVDDNGLDSAYHQMVVNLIDSYSQKDIRLIANEKNSGVQISRNKGIDSANGEYVALLDDDDEWLPAKIEEQVNVFKNSDEDLGIVYSWYIRVDIDDNGLKDETVIKLPSYESSEVVTQLLRENFIGSNSFPLLRKSFVKEVGGYDKNLPSSQDLDLWIRLSEISEIYCINKTLSKYYEHKGERITNDYNKKIDGMLKFHNKYRTLIDSDFEAYQAIFTDISSFMIKVGRYEESRRILKSIYKKSNVFNLTFRSVGLYFKSYLVQWGILLA